MANLLTVIGLAIFALGGLCSFLAGLLKKSIKKSDRILMIVVGMVLFSFTTFGCFMSVRYLIEVNNLNKAFKPIFGEAVAENKPPANFHSKGDKIVVCTKEQFTTWVIPKDKKAQKPEEVKIIAIEKREKHKVSYNEYQHVYDFTFYNVETWEIIAQHGFYGSRPTRKTNIKSQPITGSKPDDNEIREWISENIK